VHIDDATTNSKNVMSTVVYFLIFDVQQPTGQYPQCLVGSINPIHRYFSPGFPIAFYHFFLAFKLREMGKKQAFLMVFSWVMGFPHAFVAFAPQFSHFSWLFFRPSCTDGLQKGQGRGVPVFSALGG